MEKILSDCSIWYTSYAYFFVGLDRETVPAVEKTEYASKAFQQVVIHRKTRRDEVVSS